MKRIAVSVAMLPLLFCSLLLAVGGCEDDGVCRPAVPAGRIEGTVLTAGVPLDAEVAAVQVAGGAETGFSYRTEPDPAGAYGFDLPAGTYIVKLRKNHGRFEYAYRAAGHDLPDTPPDTLLVDAAHSPKGIDFVLGNVDLRLEFSDHFDGDWARVFLHRSGVIDPSAWRTCEERESGWIESGSLDVLIPGILPGEFLIEVALVCRDCEEHFWLPGVWDPSAAPSFSVIADSTVSLNFAVASEPAWIAGRIGGAWLEMGMDERPELSVVTSDSLAIVSKFRVGDDGRFAVPLHLPAQVKLRVVQNSVERWIGGPGFAEADIFTREPGTTAPEIDLAQSGLSLAVECPDGGAGYLDFEFYDPVDLSLVAKTRGDTQHANRIGIPNLWPGDYLMHVYPAAMVGKTAWRPQWYDRAAEAGEARLISIASAGEIVPLDLILEAGGEIHGSLVRQPGDEKCYKIIVTTADEYTSLDSQWLCTRDSDFE